MHINYLKRFLYLLITGFVLSISLWQCKSHVKTGTMVNAPVNQSYIDDPESDSIIAPYKTILDQQMNVVLNNAIVDLEKGRPESKLGNLISDLSMEIAASYYKPDDDVEIDFCLLNKGGLRTTIPEGPITLGLVYQVMPFENELVVVTISPENVNVLFDYLAQKGGEPISHATMGIKEGKPVNVLINGEPIDNNRNYKVLTSDYLARGGDKMYFFLEPIAYEKAGIKLRDAIVVYLEKMAIKNQSINAKIEGRIYYEQ
jgi:2',3'-cyclic-nucleotide 2'-phosphodiesterase (5'-nucleotidase family)